MNKVPAGFSLVEITIVLAIVAILMAGLLPTITGQVEQQHISQTRKQLEEIQQALIGFAISNGRLPCPADGSIATGQAQAGIEATAGSGSSMTCANAGGVLPWATLGLAETDAWGRRFSYRVTVDFADALGNTSTYGGCTPNPLPAQASFALCSSGNLTVQSAAGGSNIALGIPAVVVSHGNNGYGAYTPQGGQLPASGSADEADNSNGGNTFVSHEPTANFDDLLAWISPSILFNRMVAAGKLP